MQLDNVIMYSRYHLGYCKVNLSNVWIKHVRLPLSPDLLPPSGLHVVRVEENEVELRWDEPEPSHNLVSGFVVTYGPLGRSNRRSDVLSRHRSTHIMRRLVPGTLYNISTFSTKRNANNNDVSQPATALIRTSVYTRQCPISEKRLFAFCCSLSTFMNL